MEMDGSLVGQAFAEGRIQEIERYCLADCRATLELYRRLKAFYGAGRA
jgi:predicted PolB exonuclease-like 3'-5' exonuclease